MKRQPPHQRPSEETAAGRGAGTQEGEPAAGGAAAPVGPASREAGRAQGPPVDGLLACLLRLTQETGRPVAEADVRAQVPLAAGGMTVEQFCRAARRLGYAARRERPEARALAAMPTPFLLVGRAGAPARLALGHEAGALRLYDPEAGEVVRLAPEEAHAQAAEAILVKRAPQAGGAAANWRAAVAQRVRGVLLEIIAASFIVNILALATPLFALTVYNKVIGQRALDTLTVLAVGMLGVYAFDLVLRIVRGYISSHTGARVDALIGSEVMHHFLALPYRHFESTPTGVINERMRQLDSIRNFFTGQMPMTLVDLGFVFIFVAVIFVIHETLAWITLGVMPVFIAVSALFHRHQKRLVEDNFLAQASKATTLAETVNNALSVKALGLEPEVERRWEQRLAHSAVTGFRTNHLNNTVASIGYALQMLTSLAILFVGARLVIAGEMSIGALIASNILASRAIAPLRNVVMAWSQLQEVRAAFRRIDEIMDAPAEAEPGEVAPAPRLGGRLALEAVTFGFAPELPLVLKGVELTVDSGSILGIVGPSGSGKTTLAKLIQGLYRPDEGRVLIDGTDIQHISPPALRQQLGVVPQETQLFAGTVRENIAMGSPDKDPERVVAVAKFVGAHDFIQRLPKGYDTALGERGIGLSAGQRQLLCIARALVRNPRILILDEATSDLDPVTEEAFMRNLRRASRGRTIVVISHRTQPLEVADRVALLMNGTIERVGQPAEVMAFARTRMAEAAGQRA